MKVVEVVCAIIKNKEGKYFCCQRPLDKSLGGFWEFPGGKVEPHETYEQTIVREIHEELNATIEPIRFIMTVDHDYNEDIVTKPFHIRMHAYLCALKSDHLELLEHKDGKWVDKVEALNLTFAPADRPIVNKLFE